jgi:hypothetical protein
VVICGHDEQLRARHSDKRSKNYRGTDPRDAAAVRAEHIADHDAADHADTVKAQRRDAKCGTAGT